ncbi:hypothetical protein [Amycolatopsis cihanbeyliensis]|uniref:pPIWI-RE three-gene island domain-containing protein n=1 Tax=Amycolatopsis cihanbeyliensis TaxID=1128664 RepID=A0A542CUZ9_AMYCI|nr:hypothetical protein [Amycolatopsis cihanbeyliensis]TQI94643.1 hypothetical protein FB471_6814 [Amycolatopsis cihanbeyliensis]
MTGRTVLLDHLASGVYALSYRDAGGSTVPPYPQETQYALDLVVCECLHQGATPPAGVPELIRWCTDLSSPSWPFPPGEQCAGLALVDPVHRTRTRACAELAGLAAVAEELMAQALSDVPAGEAVERRRFLRSHVLVGPDTHRKLLMEDPPAAAVYKFVKDLYQPVPAEWVVRGKVALCECGLPARPGSPDDQLTAWCERETCPSGSQVEQRFSASKTLMLHPALRIFVALPAQAEDRLRSGLASAGLPVRSFGPAVERHEVRFPGSEPRTVQFYDRVVPTVLARDAAASGVDIAVVPDGFAMTASASRQAFADALPPGTHVTLMTESELLAGTKPTGRILDA